LFWFGIQHFFDELAAPRSYAGRLVKAFQFGEQLLPPGSNLL